LNKFNLEINADGVLFQKLAPQYVQEDPLLIRLYIDEDVHGSVGSALRQRSYDVLTVGSEADWALMLSSLDYATLKTELSLF